MYIANTHTHTQWMDGWTDGRMDGWTDGWMDGRTDGWMGWTDGRMDGCTYVCVHMAYLWEVALVVQDVENAGGLGGDQVDGRTD